MNVETQEIVQLIAACGVGTSFPAVLGYFRDRKRNVIENHKTDVDTKLIALTAVIEQLQKENRRVVDDRDRLQDELSEEQQRNMIQRQRIRELEEEIDGVRQSARDTQHRCDLMAARLKELVKSAQEGA